MTLTQRVREAARYMMKFTAKDLINKLCFQSSSDVKRLRHVVYDLRKSGEFMCLEEGVYVYRGRGNVRTKADIIWHLVRSNRQFKTDDIERLSETKRSIVLESLRHLQKAGYLRKREAGHWQLIKDPGPQTPGKTEKNCKTNKQEVKSCKKKKR